MTLVINNKLTAKELKQSLETILKNKEKKGLRKHFGLSDEKTDAIAFQKKARNEWN